MLLKTKSLTLISFCLTFLFFCSSKHKDKNKEVPLLLSAKVDSSKTQENLTFIFITTKLTNSSSDTIKYITMSCSWQDPFTADLKELVVHGKDCDKTVPKLKEILPRTSEAVSFQLTSSKTFNELKDKIFRVGFNWVTAKDFDEMFLKLPKLWEMKNVIWSGTLRIK